MDFIETAIVPTKKLSKQSLKINTPKKRDKATMNKEQLAKAKADHKAEIAKIKGEIKAKKQDIKRHNLLLKQAKIAYKLSEMKVSK